VTKSDLQRGFTLMELMIVTAIIGLLVSVALPAYRAYTVRAKVTEGVLILSELRRRVELEFYRSGTLTIDLPYSPPPDGQMNGGPFYNYSTLFGSTSEMWEIIRYKEKDGHRILMISAYEKAEWDNVDITLKLQIKLRDDDTLDFRCYVTQENSPYVPSSCPVGSGSDWTSW
jgi:prepilin-type N-terminal cleavage/methylation domain-containing protein